MRFAAWQATILVLHGSITAKPRPPGDVDINCTVGITDFLKLLAEWGHPDSPADLNGDGTVDRFDFFILIDNWG